MLERTEQGKKATKNHKKRLNPPNCRESEPASKRTKAHNNHQLEFTASNTPSPLTLNYSRPTSVLSVASATINIVNGDDAMDFQGSTDGSEVNSELSGPKTTPVHKLPAKTRLGLLESTTAVGMEVGATSQLSSLLMPPSSSSGGGRRVKQTSAPLGGRGKMQKSVSKKGGGKGGGAAASAGAIAGAKAASNAAYAAYGIPFSLSPTSSSAAAGSLAPSLSYYPTGGSTHSSPRVSPVPMAFVATSLITTPPTNSRPSPSSKTLSSLSNAKNDF